MSAIRICRHSLPAANETTYEKEGENRQCQTCTTYADRHRPTSGLTADDQQVVRTTTSMGRDGQ